MSASVSSDPNHQPRCILGIDPGLGVTGFGCIHSDDGDKYQLIDYGTIKPSAKLSLGERLVHIGQKLEEVFVRLSPDVCSIEDVFVMKYARPAINLSHARGVCFYVAGINRCPIEVYTSRSVKQTICGYGNADKQQMIYMVRHLLTCRAALEPDAADALALAICHANSRRQSMRLGMAQADLS